MPLRNMQTILLKKGKNILLIWKGNTAFAKPLLCAGRIIQH